MLNTATIWSQRSPTWLAITLFIALPGLFGTLIGPAAATVQYPGSWTSRGRSRWIIPLNPLLFVALAIPVVVVLGLAAIVLTALGTNPALNNVRATRSFGVLIRTAWLTIATTGLAALVDDISLDCSSGAVR